MKPTLVIVDDVKGIRDVVRAALAQDFAIVAEAADGTQAVEAFRQFKPELMIMDLVMPRLSGLGAIEQIMQAQETPKPIIVVLSGIRDESVVLQAMEAGAVDYLFKPPETEMLKKVLWRFLESPLKSKAAP